MYTFSSTGDYGIPKSVKETFGSNKRASPCADRRHSCILRVLDMGVYENRGPQWKFPNSRSP